MSLAARIEIRAERTARRQRVRVGASPCDGDTSEGDGLYTRDAALVWSGKTRSARPARMDKPLRCRPLEGRRDQRSPLRRCFKPRPPLSAGCAGFASGCRLSGSELRRPSLSPSGLESLGFESRPHSGRLSGLLSGCPPTGTRPQARAKLGERDISAMAQRCKHFFLRRRFFSFGGSKWLARRCGAALVRARVVVGAHAERGDHDRCPPRQAAPSARMDFYWPPLSWPLREDASCGGPMVLNFAFCSSLSDA